MTLSPYATRQTRRAQIRGFILLAWRSGFHSGGTTMEFHHLFPDPLETVSQVRATCQTQFVLAQKFLLTHILSQKKSFLSLLSFTRPACRQAGKKVEQRKLA